MRMSKSEIIFEPQSSNSQRETVFAQIKRKLDQMESEKLAYNQDKPLFPVARKESTLENESYLAHTKSEGKVGGLG